jgi:hypothetical protein
MAADFAIEPAGSAVARGRQRKHGQGGAGNGADRLSISLTPSQAATLTAAVEHVQRIGLPLNRMTTVHRDAAGVPLAAMAKATGHFTDL